MTDSIYIKGARVNNLKDIDVEIPRNKFTVVTGLSGSGKSSLAFDTLYAEGQRRYVESLSAYARQFLGRMNKPDCDYIKGLPPAIAIEQKVTTRNPRSTVGTSTEIYEYLRLLFARIGHTFSPVSGKEVQRHTVDDIVDDAFTHPVGQRFTVLAPLRVSAGRTLEEQVGVLMQQGLSRLDVGGSMVQMEEAIESPAQVQQLERQFAEGKVHILIDRLAVDTSKEGRSRLADSIQTALYEGNGECLLRWYEGNSRTGTEPVAYSTRFEADGMKFEEPTENLFAFNTPAGACPECEGFGRVVGIDEDLVIPDKALSVYDGAVVCWRGEKMGEWRQAFCELAAPKGFRIFEPYYNLTEWERDLLWHGGKDMKYTGYEDKQDVCIDGFMDMVRQNLYKIQYRVMLARYRGKTVCPRCKGSRLRPEALYVKIAGKSIADVVKMPVDAALKWFKTLQDDGRHGHDGGNYGYGGHTHGGNGGETGGNCRRIDEIGGEIQENRRGIGGDCGTSQPHGPALTEHERKIARRLLDEIVSRLQFLMDVGLPYLTLDRLSNTLSGGESQRINLATSMGSSLVGSVYILDEPSIGLHQRDTERLIGVLRKLRDIGNTVVVVEHDEEIMRAADYIIDIGPDAGRHGGEVVFAGTLPALLGGRGQDSTGLHSHTLDYLTGREEIAVPKSRRHWNTCIRVRGARQHNLKGIDATFPLHALTVVTGPSGSGKSSLVRDIFYRAMKQYLDEVAERPGQFQRLEGAMDEITAVDFVDQNPIGKSSRSNPVTYVKAYDEIRRLLAAQPLAEQMGMTAAFFSFNTEGGRCEECKGEGTVRVEMQFMADLVLTCEACHGKRFKRDVLEVRYEGKNVYEILDMTVNQAIEFFGEHRQQRIVQRLQPLQDVGLGYIKLGQPSSTLSGGENQRVKLAYYLGLERTQPTLFFFDEPTTGLHFHDIHRLLRAFDALIERGHTIVVVEHNMDVVKVADHIVDLGPEGGEAGGNLVFEGTPEDLVRSGKGYTARYLHAKLQEPKA